MLKQAKQADDQSLIDETNKKINISVEHFWKDLDEMRHTARTHFTTDCDGIKLSTIHSFKGWESDSVIIILQPESDKWKSGNLNNNGQGIVESQRLSAIIYTALTRARKNLFIINLGNSTYRDFFRSRISN